MCISEMEPQGQPGGGTLPIVCVSKCVVAGGVGWRAGVRQVVALGCPSKQQQHGSLSFQCVLFTAGHVQCLTITVLLWGDGKRRCHRFYFSPRAEISWMEMHSSVSACCLKTLKQVDWQELNHQPLLLTNNLLPHLSHSQTEPVLMSYFSHFHISVWY